LIKGLNNAAMQHYNDGLPSSDLRLHVCIHCWSKVSQCSAIWQHNVRLI